RACRRSPPGSARRCASCGNVRNPAGTDSAVAGVIPVARGRGRHAPYGGWGVPWASPEADMATAITIHDEGTSGGRIRTFKLHLAAERVTVRELIERRVTQEVEEYNRAQPEYFQGLVQPTDAERVLNGYRLRQKRMLDLGEQRARAVE